MCLVPASTECQDFTTQLWTEYENEWIDSSEENVTYLCHSNYERWQLGGAASTSFSFFRDFDEEYLKNFQRFNFHSGENSQFIWLFFIRWLSFFVALTKSVREKIFFARRNFSAESTGKSWKRRESLKSNRMISHQIDIVVKFCSVFTTFIQIKCEIDRKESSGVSLLPLYRLWLKSMTCEWRETTDDCARAICLVLTDNDRHEWIRCHIMLDCVGVGTGYSVWLKIFPPHRCFCLFIT